MPNFRWFLSDPVCRAIIGAFPMRWRGSQRIRRAKLASAAFKDYLQLRLRCRSDFPIDY